MRLYVATACSTCRPLLVAQRGQVEVETEASRHRHRAAEGDRTPAPPGHMSCENRGREQVRRAPLDPDAVDGVGVVGGPQLVEPPQRSEVDAATARGAQHQIDSWVTVGDLAHDLPRRSDAVERRWDWRSGGKVAEPGSVTSRLASHFRWSIPGCSASSRSIGGDNVGCGPPGGTGRARAAAARSVGHVRARARPSPDAARRAPTRGSPSPVRSTARSACPRCARPLDQRQQTTGQPLDVDDPVAQPGSCRRRGGGWRRTSRRRAGRAPARGLRLRRSVRPGGQGRARSQAPPMCWRRWPVAGRRRGRFGRARSGAGDGDSGPTPSSDQAQSTSGLTKVVARIEAALGAAVLVTSEQANLPGSVHLGVEAHVASPCDGGQDDPSGFLGRRSVETDQHRRDAVQRRDVRRRPMPRPWYPAATARWSASTRRPSRRPSG